VIVIIATAHHIIASPTVDGIGTIGAEISGLCDTAVQRFRLPDSALNTFGHDRMFEYAWACIIAATVFNKSYPGRIETHEDYEHRDTLC